MAGGTSKKHDVVGTAVHWLLIGVRIDLFRFEGCERISSTSNDVCIQVHQNLQRGFQFLLAGEERRKISLVIMREYKLLKCMAIHDQSQKFSRDVLGKGYFSLSNVSPNSRLCNKGLFPEICFRATCRKEEHLSKTDGQGESKWVHLCIGKSESGEDHK